MYLDRTLYERGDTHHTAYRLGAADLVRFLSNMQEDTDG
mgnify:CR=1 FL=1|jgi:hypothetical protein